MMAIEEKKQRWFQFEVGQGSLTGHHHSVKPEKCNVLYAYLGNDTVL